MELLDLIGKYEGATIGVLGSGSTLNDFKSEINSSCDVVIACNGSVMALNPSLHSFDYFLYGDRKSPQRQWFDKSILFKNNEGFESTRILPTFMLPYDYHVLRYEGERQTLENELKNFLAKKQHMAHDTYFDPDISEVEVFGYVHMYQESLFSIIEKDNLLYGKGTITGVGAQIAFKMGAKQINLYGCGFNNENNRGNYAYDSQGEFGETSLSQREEMDKILTEIKGMGTDVISFGETNLTVPKVIII